MTATFKLPDSFLEARTPPRIPLFSQQSIDWHNEHIRRSFEGYSEGGLRITGDEYFFLNFCSIQKTVLNARGQATDSFEFGRPLVCQEDDYLFKQIEEAQQSRMDVMLFTGRGYGKTYLVNSIGIKYWYFLPKGAHCVTSASGDDHANATWKKVQASIGELNRQYPALSRNLLQNSPEFIQSGQVYYKEDGTRDSEEHNLWEKIVYANKPGKSKGRRLDFQHLEEVGDWGGAATLKQCIGASEGSWVVGGLKRCKTVYYTGTGGTVLSNQAKEIFWNPGAYNLYQVKTWKRPSAIFIPAMLKYGGTWEETGVSDVVAAEAKIDAKRELFKDDTEKLEMFTQEFPKTPDECFRKQGGTTFNMVKLALQKQRLENNADEQILKPVRGILKAKKIGHTIVGAEFIHHHQGKIIMIEPPELHQGESIPGLYVAGYDGIAMGGEDTVSGKGSLGALAIKKRMNPYLRMAAHSNLYVMAYAERPDDLDELHENVMLALMLYDAKVNIEFSANGNALIPYLEKYKQDFRLMKRPRLTWGDGLGEKESNLIGTVPTVKNILYGLEFLKRYVKDHSEMLFLMEQIDQMIDFDFDNRTFFDWIMAMIMCELGDNELGTVIEKPEPKVYKDWGFVYDAYGNPVWQEIPKKSPLADFAQQSNAELIKALNEYAFRRE